MEKQTLPCQKKSSLEATMQKQALFLGENPFRNRHRKKTGAHQIKYLS